MPKDRIESPIGSRSCCCIQGDQCPNPFEDRIPNEDPFAPSDANPFANDYDDEYGGFEIKSSGSLMPVPLQPPPEPLAAPETCPGSDAKACCYNDQEIGM